jgi:HD-GYP domain-containing protein (c-di-GMP phosphodiesterase class II)
VIRDRGAALIDALDQHLPGAREHAEATGAYAFAAAVALGFREDEAELCREVAKLHDVGKLYVPREILARPAAELDDASRERLRGHHAQGAGLAAGAGIPEAACAWIRAAGESFDGSGPQGLSREEIPLGARIARAACQCDLLLADPAGPDDPAERRDAAVNGLRRQLGRTLDPAVVAALVAILRAAA